MHEGYILYIMRVLNREIQTLRDNIMSYRLEDTFFVIEYYIYINPVPLFVNINEISQI